MDFVHYQAPNRRKEQSKAAAAADASKQPASDATTSNNSTTTDDNSTNSNGPNGLKGSEQHEELETATRPRLTREQADLLERHFQDYYKPSGNMKRELASITGLSLQRIANWFQNRRAKAKQQKKQEEFELQQAMASANSNTLVMANHAEYFPMPEQYAPDMEFSFHQPVVEHTPFDQMRNFQQAAFTAPRHGMHVDTNFLSVQRSIDDANRAIASGVYDHLHNSQNFSALDLSIPTSMAGQPPFALNGPTMAADEATSAFPTSAYSDWSSRNSSAIWTPARQSADPFEFQHHMHREPMIQEAMELAHNGMAQDEGMEELCGLNPADQFAHAVHMEQQKNPFMIQNLPAELVHRPQQAPPVVPEMITHEPLPVAEEQFTPKTEVPSEAGSQTTPPANAEDVFKLPEAPLNIAARRKRPRPAAIGGAALRSQSFMGSMPMSPKSHLLGGTSPMRRIKSAGNNLDAVRGRIQKNISVSGQKSPLNFETFADAGVLDVIAPRAITRAQTEGSAVPASAGITTSSANLAPPTPLSPRFHLDSHSSSNDSERPWVYDSAYPGCFAPMLGELQSDVASPPMTPMHPDLLQSLYMPNYSPAVSSGTPQWSLSSPEEPLTSPLFSTFQAPVHMPPRPVIQTEPDAPVTFQQLHFVPENKMPGQETHASISLPSGEPSAMVSAAASTESKVGVPEFFFHEPLPEQQPQPPQEMMHPRPRHYTFANQGPEDF
ncbi:MAG: hypothetical protein M1814_004511 [Vezdaea aestivalis]|nr:MAG: hypothetical protein M1814_004511 [Vezdaea aestivalis]